MAGNMPEDPNLLMAKIWAGLAKGARVKLKDTDNPSVKLMQFIKTFEMKDQATILMAMWMAVVYACGSDETADLFEVFLTNVKGISENLGNRNLAIFLKPEEKVTKH